MFGLSQNSAVIGIIGTALTGFISLAGIYYKATRDRGESREQRYEDGLWKTINMLTAKVEALEKRSGEQDEQIDSLRNSNFEVRKQLYDVQNELALARSELDRKQTELSIVQRELSDTRSEITRMRTEKQSNTEEFRLLRTQIEEVKGRESALLKETQAWRNRIDFLEEKEKATKNEHRGIAEDDLLTDRED
jgi:chromosome segregation ATPase